MVLYVSTLSLLGDRLASVSMSQMVFENAIKDLLLVRQYRVEVYASKGKVRARNRSYVEHRCSAIKAESNIVNNFVSALC